ncbi:potassium channel family protein [Actinomycetospora chlora]|uniref:Potassium channel family protein n=1 Tax=Actinomycetospora chlora TaxID=663608 RepID=A0ABP9BSU9_9PSEU
MEADAPSRRRIALVLARSTITVALLLVVYFALPLHTREDDGTLVLFLAGMAVLVAMVVWQLRAITTAVHPALRAVEAFASAIPLFILIFASTYVVLDGTFPGTFSEPMSRVDALYFTVTVFATVGFGDIVPLSQPARILVTVQMVGDLLVLGLLVNAMLEAVRRGRSRRGGTPPS